MHLVIDSKIPFIRGYAEQLGTCTYLPGAEITASDVREADALIIRTRTHCNRALLEGSRVQFIATATIGYDHIDTDYLKEAGIAWTNCPGCNARSVAQYVESALLLLAAHGCWDEQRTRSLASAPVCATDLDRSVFQHLTLGIVGVGHVGKEVLRMAERLGFRQILLCDPPRAEREGDAAFTSLTTLAREADIITFHTPLTRHPSPYATYHIANAAFLQSLRPSAVLINSSRGEVVDNQALLHALEQGHLRTAVVDTWENEPQPLPSLLQRVFLGTPHIAGYSADGKANGTRMALTAVAHHFGLDATPFATITAPTLPNGYAYYPEGSGHLLAPELRLYDPTRDSEALKKAPELFEKLRGDYPLRREK